MTYNLFSENAALNKPAYISLVSGDSLVANGNDGKLITCATAVPEPYPWWAVDLGQRYLLTNTAVYTTYILGKHA